MLLVALTAAAIAVRGQEPAPTKSLQGDQEKKSADDVRNLGDQIGVQVRAAVADATRQVQAINPQPFVINFGNSHEGKIREAAEAVRDAKDDQARSQATAKLREALDAYFSEDMANRAKELQGIQERLQKLQAQLERRRAKKDEIIELAMKNALNDADGLGFYSQPAGPRPDFLFPPPADRYLAPEVRIVNPMPPGPPVPATPPAPATSAK
jgi:hypothetical protein